MPKKKDVIITPNGKVKKRNKNGQLVNVSKRRGVGKVDGRTFSSPLNGLDGGSPQQITEQEVKERTIQWLKERAEQKKPYTLASYALAIGTTPLVIRQYEVKKDDRFARYISYARAMCEDYAESRLFGDKQASGAMYWLKNNADYSDKREMIHSGTVNLADLYNKTNAIDGTLTE